MTHQNEPKVCESPTIDELNSQIKRNSREQSGAHAEEMLQHLRKRKQAWVDGDTLTRMRVGQDVLSILFIQVEGAMERLHNADATHADRMNNAEIVRQSSDPRARINREIERLAEEMKQRWDVRSGGQKITANDLKTRPRACGTTE